VGGLDGVLVGGDTQGRSECLLGLTLGDVAVFDETKEHLVLATGGEFGVGTVGGVFSGGGGETGEKSRFGKV